MKDIKHIRRDFYSVAWVMPQGLDFVGTGGLGAWLGVKNYFIPKFNRIWCVSDSHEWRMQRHNFFVWGAKRSNMIKIQLLSQFQLF